MGNGKSKKKKKAEYQSSREEGRKSVGPGMYRVF